MTDKESEFQRLAQENLNAQRGEGRERKVARNTTETDQQERATDKDESRFPTEIPRKMVTALTKMWATNGRRKGGRQE